MPGVAVPAAAELIEDSADLAHGCSSLKKAHRVAEHRQAIALICQPAPRPARVLGREGVVLGARHQAEDAAGGVPNASHVALRAVGIDRKFAGLAVLVDIAEDHLPGLLQ